MFDLKLKGLIAWTYFWDHKLKAFYPLGLNEKEEYLFKSHTILTIFCINDFLMTFLFIYPLIYLFTCLFIPLLIIYLLFTYFNNSRR